MNGLVGLEGLTPGARVVVAMSGGVDSSVAAACLVERGFDVVGVTLQLYDHGSATGRKGACCAGQDIHDAKRVADRLGIAHYVLDFEERFRSSVIDEFAATYARGQTPIPCVLCNERIKFADLLSVAKDLGAASLATGHYVRRVPGVEGPELHRALDPERDQSYFLFATTLAQLDFLRFPLGHLTKAEVRSEAQRLGLAIADKPDSQDICFVPQGRYAAVVERLRPEAAEPGEIVDLKGNVLGCHKGIVHYTVGQRRGLGLAAGEPLFVVGLDAASKRVVVGPRQALLCSGVELRTINVLMHAAERAQAEGTGLDILVRVRSTREPRPARLRLFPGGGGRIALPEGEEGVSPGQACVFYDCEAATRVLGGGWIESTRAMAVPEAVPLDPARVAPEPLPDRIGGRLDSPGPSP